MVCLKIETWRSNSELLSSQYTLNALRRPDVAAVVLFALLLLAFPKGISNNNKNYY